MGRTSILVSVVFLVGLVIGWFAQRAANTIRQKDSRSADLTAIEKLHQADVEATLRQDPAYLDELWSQDCIKVDGAERTCDRAHRHERDVCEIQG